MSTLLYYLIYAPLSLLWAEQYIWWVVIAYAPSGLLNFRLQKFYTFGHTGTETIRTQAALFFGKEIAFFGLNILLLYVLEQWEPGNPNWHQILITPPQALVSYFVTHRIFAR